MRRGFAYAQQPPRGKTSYMPVARPSHCHMQKTSAGKFHDVFSEKGLSLTDSISRSLGYSHDQSALILAVRITLPHFSVSCAMCLPKSAGEPMKTVLPNSA